VQHIGKLLVVWRPQPKDSSAKRTSGKGKARVTKRSMQGSTKR